jgi:hypothetical protein
LHAYEAVEGPFAVKLVDGLHVWRVSRETLFGGDVLAGVVAFGGAVPEEEAAVEGCVALGEVWGERRGKLYVLAWGCRRNWLLCRPVYNVGI